MSTVIIKTQAEYDALPKSFESFTWVEIRSDPKVEIVVRTVPDPGSSQVRAYDSSQVRAYDSSQVRAYDSSQVTAYDSSQVTAYDSSQVRAYDSSQVRAYGSSQVTAYGSSQVRAYDSSQVRAYGSSQVRAYGSSQVSVHSINSVIELAGFAVAMLLAKAKVKRSGKTTTVITPNVKAGVSAWLERHGITPANGRVILFKRVSKDLKTQEGTINETTWTPGTTLTMPADKWDPSQECGPGKFHACPATHFCDQFRAERGDKYIAIEVAVKDLHLVENPEYPHKIALREAKVLYVCNWSGKELA